MQKRIFHKAVMASALFIVSACATSVQAAESPKDKINHWIHMCPYIGLVAKDVSYGPVTLKDLDLDGKGRVVIAQPGEDIQATVRYKIDAKDLESFHRHHVIVGLKAKGAQSCITHALGIWDAKGKAHFSLKAPKEKGVYEIRFDYQTAVSCADALKQWNEDQPSSKATVGILIVE